MGVVIQIFYKFESHDRIHYFRFCFPIWRGGTERKRSRKNKIETLVNHSSIQAASIDHNWFMCCWRAHQINSHENNQFIQYLIVSFFPIECHLYMYRNGK